MSLRKKLSFRSTLLFIATMLFVTVGTYLLSQYFVDQTYRQELLSIARLSALFYLEKDEVNAKTHSHIENQFMKISDVDVRLYRTNSTLYIEDSVRFEASDKIIARTIREGHLFFKVKNRSFLALYYRDNEGDFVVMASGLDESGQEQLHFVGRMLLFFGLMGSGLHLILSFLLARKTFEPFQQLISQVKSIRGNDWQARLSFPRKDDDEVKQFINEFNYLLDRIESSASIQRNFLRNASHEIKTPLAVIIGDIEVALNSSRSEEEYITLLHALRKNGHHLRSVIESLMTLSDLEVAGSDLVTKFRIDEVIWEVVGEKNIEYRGRKINVHFQEGTESSEQILTINANRALLQIAISNIIDNALKYSQGAVDIIIHATKFPLAIEIIDTGIGIPPEDLQKIFEIFYRSPSSQMIQGHGIGLYLSRQIFKRNKAEVSVSSSPGSGTLFKIVFSK